MNSIYLYSQQNDAINKKILLDTPRSVFITVFVLTVGLFCNFFFSNDYLGLICNFGIWIFILTCKITYLLPTMIYFSFFSYICLFGRINICIFMILAFIVRVMLQKREYLLIGIVFLPVYIIISLLSTDVFAISIGDLIPFFAFSCLLFACLIYKHAYKNACISYFIRGHIVASFMGLFKEYTRLGQIMETDYISMGTWQNTVRYSGLSYDPNFYSLSSILVLCILLFGFGYSAKSKFSWIVLTLLTAFGGIMTYSKSWVLCFFVTIVMSFLNPEKGVKKKFFGLISVALVVYLMFKNQIDVYFQGITMRFNDSANVNEFSSGRVELWQLYGNMLFDTFSSTCIGHGIVNSLGLHAAHNTYLEILYKFGVLGFILNVFCIWLSQKKVLSSRFKFKIKNFTIILLIGIMLFNLSAHTFYLLWVLIFMIIILVKEQKLEDIR